MEEEKKDLVYKDVETGHILFGQAVLAKNTEELRNNTRAIYAIGLLFFALLLGVFVFLFWYVHTFNVLNNIVARCL